MYYQPQKLKDLVLITPEVHEDHRGFFMETFRQDEFEKHCGKYQFVQDNHSRSQKGTLRGLHYQLKHPQGKLIRVTQGEVYDVAVDCRKNSPSFGQWQGFTLSAENKHMLWVPPGFAHGFLVMSEIADFVYKCTNYYDPTNERGFRWDDPILDIQWPDIKVDKKISAKDESGTNFSVLLDEL
ncbi:dTDP-4-dehydrorhamnose 3,5-epimerase [Saliniradius amylolyticus]|uniref:dTDP-4-dehydrorhamnose 3,5-epimerase n=1 Tax=Saliniradius amylolyticus TaxID=2183582 RepID=A0A2S2E1T2_9ALTE|nr:dTDP-4-dehydrorhamnose 3,5-epimerase [Saliniradius amylolyticus]AWL11220.1 dTDP-4-dehydrorhamnose 3,5-epimerase [Saliniradius amylolyticus]